MLTLACCLAEMKQPLKIGRRVVVMAAGIRHLTVCEQRCGWALKK
jgi:hypothetical protein